MAVARQPTVSRARRAAALVLAAGAGSRFGGVKLLASLEGRPLLQHVLDAVAAAGLGDVVVVLGDAADEIEAQISWRAERRIRNPHPEAGLSSSLRIGLAAVAALDHEVAGVLVLLGDQPLVRPDVIARLLDAPRDPARPIVVPRYAAAGGANPAFLMRAAWPLADGLTGDRGMGPVIAAHPELVHEVSVEGENPDVDTREDLEALGSGGGDR